MKWNMLRGLLATVFLTVVLLVPQTAAAQFAEKAKWYAGLTYSQVNLTPVPAVSPVNLYFYGLTVGMNYVLLHSNDVVSLGANPSALFSVQFDQNLGINMLASAPVFLLARVGANATPFNEQKFGVGAGVGLNYSYLSYKFSNAKINQGFLNPSAVVEIGINARNWNNIIRFHWSLYKPSHDIRIGIDKAPYRFGTGGLGFLYNF